MMGQVDQLTKLRKMNFGERGLGGRGRQPAEINLSSICQQLVLGRAPFNNLKTFYRGFHNIRPFHPSQPKKIDKKNQDNKHNIDRQLYQNKLIIKEANKNARNFGEKYREGKLVQISGWRSQPQAHGASSPQNLENFLHLSDNYHPIAKLVSSF